MPESLSPARRWYARLVFPLTLVGALWAAHSAVAAGFGYVVALIAGLGPAVAVVTLSERIQPHSPAWSRSRGDVRTDLLHMIFSQVLPPPLVDLVMRGAAVAGAAWLSARLGMALWPDSWNVWLQLALALLVGELGQYAWHRLCHEHELFWRFHAVHHSSTRLYWLNAGRFHPIDTVVSYTAEVLPLILLGCPPHILFLFAVFTAVHGLFQHANIEVRLGPLNWIFSMAELHRWHHSKDIRVANANYGANLIVWDIVFGTRKLPRDRDHPAEDVGFEGVEEFPGGFAAQLASPFRRRGP